MRGVTPRLGKKAPQKAKTQVKAVEAKRQADELRTRQRQLSLHGASVLNSQPIIQPRTAAPKPQKSSVPATVPPADDVEGPGLVARLKAFLSFRGFNTTGITSAHVLQKSASGRNLKARPNLAASQPSQEAQAPQLNKFAPAKSRLELRKAQAPQLKTVAPAKDRLERKSVARVKTRRKSKTEKATAKVDVPKRRSLHKTERLERARKKPFRSPRTSGVAQLRQDLCLDGGASILEDAVYVSIDTEFRSRSVLELGVSTLDTRDIAGIKPDHRAANWISKVKHYHFVPTHYHSRDASRLGRAIFCTSQPASSASIRTIVLSLLQIARDRDGRCRKVHVVGQSISGDLNILANSPTVRIDFLSGDNADFSFDRVFDTNSFAAEAKLNGVHLPNGQLGPLARRLGVDSRFRNRDTVLGTHNASNDAAYAMMVMLLFAVRWDELPSLYPIKGAKWEPRISESRLGQLKIHPNDRRRMRAQENYEQARLGGKISWWTTKILWGTDIVNRFWGRGSRTLGRVHETGSRADSRPQRLT